MYACDTFIRKSEKEQARMASKKESHVVYGLIVEEGN